MKPKPLLSEDGRHSIGISQSKVGSRFRTFEDYGHATPDTPWRGFQPAFHDIGPSIPKGVIVNIGRGYSHRGVPATMATERASALK
jgi:hypothetical protein